MANCKYSYTLESESYDNHNTDSSTMEKAKIGDGAHFVNDAARKLDTALAGKTSIPPDDIAAADQLDTHMISAMLDACVSNIDAKQDFVKAACGSGFSTSLISVPQYFSKSHEEPQGRH